MQFFANPKANTKKKMSSVQKFPQTFVVILQFSMNSKVKTKKKKKGLCPQSLMKSGASSQKLRKNSSCSRILGR